MAVQQTRPQNRIILVIGVLLAIVATIGVFLALRGLGGTAGEATQDAYVAAGDIAAGTQLTPDLFVKQAVPQSLLPADAITDNSVVTGKTAPITLSKNQILTNSFLSAQVGPGGTALPVSTYLPITKGDVAMAIPVTGAGSVALTTVGYYIQPEDHIDILADLGAQPCDPNLSGLAATKCQLDAHDIKYLMQDVRVIKVGGASAATAGTLTPPAYYVIELPRNQAEILTAFFDGKAGFNQSILTYVLRPHSEYSKTGAPPNYENNSGVGIPSVPDPGASPNNLQNSFT